MHAAAEASGGPALEELDRAECLRLIAPGGVGRVAFDDGEGPAVLPVNYALDGENVVFRTTLEGRLSRSLTSALAGTAIRIAFEVDRIDEASQQGWSVMLRGGARHLTEQESAGATEVEPWPGGKREAHIVLTPRDISGRRISRP